MSTESAPQKSKKQLYVILGVAGGLLAILLCCGVPAILIAVIGFGSKKGEEAKAKQVQEGNALELTATTLIREYKDNEVSANGK